MKFKDSDEPFSKLLGDYKKRGGSANDFISAMYTVGRNANISSFEQRLRNVLPDSSRGDVEDDVAAHAGRFERLCFLSPGQSVRTKSCNFVGAWFYTLSQKCQRLEARMSSRCIKPVASIKSVKIRLGATEYLPTYCKLLKKTCTEPVENFRH